MKTYTKAWLSHKDDGELAAIYKEVLGGAPGSDVTRNRQIDSILETQAEEKEQKEEAKMAKRTKSKRGVGKAPKAKAPPKKCAVCKKAETRTPRAKFCGPCLKKRRTKQLADNNVVWRGKLKAGKSKHHLTYRGRPTVWASENKKAALAQAKRQAAEAEKNGYVNVVALAQTALKEIPKARPAKEKAA